MEDDGSSNDSIDALDWLDALDFNNAACACEGE